MVYTSHGHHIPGTVLGKNRPERVMRCGGPNFCTKCRLEASSYINEETLGEGMRLTSQYFGINEARRIHMADIEKTPTPERYAHAGPFMTRAMEEVYAYVKERLDKTDTVEFDITMVYVVWFSKTLGNWKALISTALPDGKYYEITYDGANDCIYLDAYVKFQNVRIDFGGRDGGTQKYETQQ